MRFLADALMAVDECGRRLSLVRNLAFDDLDKQRRFDEIDLTGLANECTLIDSLARRLDSSSVLCHCDLLAGNVLTPFQVRFVTLMGLACIASEIIPGGQG